MVSVKVFLSGSVQKGEHDTRSSQYFWSDAEEATLRNLLHGINVEILNPNRVTIDQSQSIARFKADLKLLIDADVVVVDARTKKGLGVGAELMMAHYEYIPVLALCPNGSEYRRNGNTHAFIAGLTSGVFGTLNEIAHEISCLLEGGQIPRKQRGLLTSNLRYDI